MMWRSVSGITCNARATGAQFRPVVLIGLSDPVILLKLHTDRDDQLLEVVYSAEFILEASEHRWNLVGSD